jgi:hypothetical protein
MSIRATIERAPAEGESEALLAPRSSLDLSDPVAPRARLADGSWRVVELGECAPLESIVTRGLDEGDELGYADSGQSGDRRRAAEPAPPSSARGS